MNTGGLGSILLGILAVISWILIPIGIVLVIVGLVRYFW